MNGLKKMSTEELLHHVWNQKIVRDSMRFIYVPSIFDMLGGGEEATKLYHDGELKAKEEFDKINAMGPEEMSRVAMALCARDESEEDEEV
jgi:hypothetical protein